jgi:hypothetical protein
VADGRSWRPVAAPRILAAMSPAVLAALVGVLFTACQGAPPPLPAGAGRGVLAADAAPPAGAATWNRPEWRVGDRFELVRGDHLPGAFTVAVVDADGYRLDAGGGMFLRRDLDLGNLGECTADGRLLHALSPADVRYHWPLWVGKTWRCEFVDRAPGGILGMQADYVVEALDRVTVPAGTFDALRVVRRVRLLGGEAEHLTRAQIAWYAPEVGSEVRQLVGDSLVELRAVHRPR